MHGMNTKIICNVPVVKGTPYVCLYIVFSAERYEGELMNIFGFFSRKPGVFDLNFKAVNTERY